MQKKKKEESRPKSYPFTKIKSKWIIDLKCKMQYNPLEDNILENLNDLGMVMSFR